MGARKRSHKRFTMIRVSEDTRARLQAVQDEILALIDKGTIPDPGTNPEQINPNAKALSMDALINLLLDRREQHKERARKARKAKRKGGESC